MLYRLFFQRSILEGIWILYVVFFVLGNIYGGNTARPPSRPDPRTGVRFCVDPAGGGLRRGPLTRRGAACVLHAGTLRGGGGRFKKSCKSARNIKYVVKYIFSGVMNTRYSG